MSKLVHGLTLDEWKAFGERNARSPFTAHFHPTLGVDPTEDEKRAFYVTLTPTEQKEVQDRLNYEMLKAVAETHE